MDTHYTLHRINTVLVFSNTIDRQEKLKIVYTEKQALKCLENYFIDSIRSQEGDENDVGSNSSNERILS